MVKLPELCFKTKTAYINAFDNVLDEYFMNCMDFEQFYS